MTAAVRMVELFGGIGGMRLGAEIACPGAKTVFVSEIDESACRTYAANHGDAPAGDITLIDAGDIPEHDLLLAGFPCQDISIAGKMEGLHGVKSGLFFQIVRIAEHHQPPLIVIENVPMLRTMEHGRTFKVVKDSVERIGYRLRFRLLDASDYGCPTSRERLFIVCFRSDLDADAFHFPFSLGVPTSLRDCLLPDLETRRYAIGNDRAFVPNGRAARLDWDGTYPQRPVCVGNADGRDAQGYRVYDPNAHAITFSANGGGLGAQTGLYLVDGVVRRLAPVEAAMAMGFPVEFQFPVNDYDALHQIGNSVAVPVVQAVVRAALEVTPFSNLQAYSQDECRRTS